MGHSGLCSGCAQRDRVYLHEARKVAQEYANIYSWVYIDTLPFQQRWYKDVAFLFVGISVQVMLPIAIAVQLRQDLLENNSTICPHGKGSDASLGRLLAFVLSFYFGLSSIASFLGKIRGNTFLLFFCPTSSAGKIVLTIGLLSQVARLCAANAAEFFLFVDRGSKDFLLLLFTSLTMLSTLNADATFISEDKREEATEIIEAVLSDDIIGLPPDGNDLPKGLIEEIHQFRKIYNGLAFLLFLFCMFLTTSVTYCIS